MAVGDVVEQAAREVGVAVAVQVAVGDRRALRHRLLVAEVVVVVQVDVDRVVLAGRVRVGDEDRRPLAVELEQVVVGVAVEPDRAGLRPARRERVGVDVRAGRGGEVPRRAGAGGEAAPSRGCSGRSSWRAGRSASRTCTARPASPCTRRAPAQRCPARSEARASSTGRTPSASRPSRDRPRTTSTSSWLQVCHVPIRSGWPQSVPPSSTEAVTPVPV